MSLTVICGPMFAGKSSRLAHEVRRRVMFGHGRALVVAPKIDTRWPFSTHDGVALAKTTGVDVNVVETDWSVRSMAPAAREMDLVAIDEGQFFLEPPLLSAVANLRMHDVDVMVAGLDTDFKGRPFGVMSALLAVADTVVKLTAVCVPCGAPATRSYRKIHDTSTVLLGGAEAYEARCYACWLKGTER
jgi:thymidine kinase